ncbi:MAG TPA: hypothetical protein VGJ59_11150 [Jatrophihabitantaceae bacterium]|jgi:hypothetical protein
MPVPVAPVEVQLVHTACSSPFPLSVQANVIAFGLTLDSWRHRGGAVQSQMTAGSFDGGA